MPITALPTPPLRSDPTNFATRADAFLAALPTFQSEANTLQTDVNAKQVTASAAAVSAAADAAAATSNAAAAATSAGAIAWVSGTTYAIGDARYSPANRFIYRRLTAGAGTTDPSADATNWILMAMPRGLQTITGTVAANAMTVGTPAGSLDFRSATLTSGAVNLRTYGALSLVIPSGATLGTVNGVKSRIAVLEIDNAGTVELAVVNLAGTDLREDFLINTTAISAGATSATTFYSTTARTGVPYRLIGYIESTQATAGTWATAPSLLQGAGGGVTTNSATLFPAFSAYNSGIQSIPSATYTKVVCNTEEYDLSSNFDSVTNSRFVAPFTGIYSFKGVGGVLSTADQLLALYKNGANARVGGVADSGGNLATELYLIAGDYVELYMYQTSGGSLNIGGGSVGNIFQGYLVKAL